jgi:hypothetical protein
VNLNNSRNLYVRRQACRGENQAPNSCGSNKISAHGGRRWGRALLAGVIQLLVPGFAAAQGSVATPRIAARVDESRLMELRGNMHPLARPQYDQGKVDPSFQLERITMMFQPTTAQQADLDALLAAQQNPKSPNFHKWLTPEQYADRFGIAQSDLKKVTAWLQAQGFAVVEIPPGRNSIVFNGTAAQVESALHSEVHNYKANGKNFYANSSEPSVPAALAGIMLGFRGLNNFPLKPRSLKSLGSSVQPNFTSGSTGNHFLSPGDFATIYDLNPLYSSSPAIDGTGQKIAIVGQSNIQLADIAKFRSLSSLPANVPTVTLVPGSTDPGIVDGDVVEASLDIEWAGAVAKNATIQYVYSTNAFASLNYVVQQNLAPVVSVSYGACETSFSGSELSGLVVIAQQANAQGITIVSASGDGGATDCDGDIGNYPAILGLNVDVPASLPYVTGVGGTEFNDGNGAGYWQATTVPPPNGTDIVNSALSYIPEIAWNDSLTTGTLAGGGGGASSIFGKPTWQTGTGVPNDGARDIPDVSLNASTAHVSYLVCTQTHLTPTAALTSSCQNGFRNTDGSLTLFGGTSFGAPTFSGILALVNQKTASSGQGNANYILYPLAASSPNAFHDIVTGDIKSPCTIFSLDCLDGNPIGYSTGLGYDLATGLGTIDALNLVNSWSSIGTSGGSTPVLSSINPTTTSSGSTDFTLTATGTSFATNAQILWNGSTAGVTMQSGGTATSIKATISHTLVAYGTTAMVTVTDDATKAGESSASQTFTVTNSTPPANDNIAQATPIHSTNFTDTVDNSAATMQVTDPATLPCATASMNPRTKTVWWLLPSTGQSTVTLSTMGSPYDTTLSVWTGAPGSLTNVACNDDISIPPSVHIKQSQLTFTTGGTPTSPINYYIMVAPFGPPDTGSDLLGGKTVLNVTNATLAPAAPVITSGVAATFTEGVAGSFSVTATGSPAPTFTLTTGNLPAGLSLNSITGAISGIPAAGTASPYPITITATNGTAPDATQMLTLTVNRVPAISSGSSTTFTVGTSGSFTVTALGSPAPTLSESGTLPSGVTFTSGTGVLGGTPGPGTGGTYPIKFTAHNAAGSDAIQNFTLTVNQGPAITSANSTAFTVGTAGSFTVTATGTPAPTFAESGSLPTGVTLNTTTGVLSGTPAAGTVATYPINFTAHNGVGADATQTFTLTVNPAPSISVTPGTSPIPISAAGQLGTSLITVSGTNIPSAGDSVTLTCAVTASPAGAVYPPTCNAFGVPDSTNFTAPNIINLTTSATTGNTTMTVSTTPKTAAILRPTSRPLGPNWFLVSEAGAFIACLFLLGISAQKRRSLVLLGMLIFAVLAVGTSCGSAYNGSGGGNPGTTLGTYTITVTATPQSGAAQTTTIMVKVGP